MRVIEETPPYWKVVFENPPFNIVDATLFEGLQDLLGRMNSSMTAASDPSAEALRIAVSPIVVPALIDRPQLVVRTSGHEIAVLENHRWAEPLSVDLTRALITDLQRPRPGVDIVAAGAPQSQPEQILDVEITELLSGPGP